ncbi:MAG: phosphatase PAP2 family protein [Bermanella sp.]
MQQLAQLDTHLLKWAYQRPFRNSPIIKALIFMGDAPFWMLIIAVAALVGQALNILTFEMLSISLMLGLSIGHFTFGQLKIRVKRRRPYANASLQQKLNITIDNRDPGHASKEFESFPSGHVFWTTVSVSLIAFQFGIIGAILFGWMIPAMMFLRLHLGVHYPSDILAGLTLGILISAVTHLLFPLVWEFLTPLKTNQYYLYGYGLFVVIFLMVGMKAWLKRV